MTFLYQMSRLFCHRNQPSWTARFRSSPRRCARGMTIPDLLYRQAYGLALTIDHSDIRIIILSESGKNYGDHGQAVWKAVTPFARIHVLMALQLTACNYQPPCPLRTLTSTSSRLAREQHWRHTQLSPVKNQQRPLLCCGDHNGMSRWVLFPDPPR